MIAFPYSENLALLALSGTIIGISKTGIPGAMILAVPLMASAFSARISVGLILPMLLAADVFSAIYYRRYVCWRHLLLLLPPALIGIAAGFLAMTHIDDGQLERTIGAIVLLMLVTRFTIRRMGTSLNVHEVRKNWRSLILSSSFGLFAGFTTMLANAAGPVITLYLLISALPKRRFVATAGWFFFLVNWIKVPFFLRLDLINSASLLLDLTALPFVVAGALLGIAILGKIQQRTFDDLAGVLAFLAALKLII